MDHLILLFVVAVLPMLLLVCCEDGSQDAEGGDDDDVVDTGSPGVTEDIAAGELVGPVERDGKYVIEMNNGAETILFECQAESGGLITGLSLNGTNIIADDSIGALYGSVFWTSPQSDWDWPPPAAIDTDAYTVGADEDTGAITLTSGEEPDLAVQIVKRFSPDPANMAIDLQYVIRNIGTEPRSFAPWEITRVTTGGLTFFPTGLEVYESNMDEMLTTDAIGVTWFEHIAENVPSGDNKIYRDGARGWLAHAKDGLLFVKSFNDEPPENRAPDHGEIEIYVKQDGYEELENQGAYQEIPAGGEITWNVKWYIRNIPAGATAAVGDQALVDFIDSLTQ